MTENMKKCSFYLTNEADALIESHREGVVKCTRSEFVESAIRDYCERLDGARDDLSGRALLKEVKSAIKDGENHVAHCVFKLAGEMGLLSYYVGANLLYMTDQGQRQSHEQQQEDEVRKTPGGTLCKFHFTITMSFAAMLIPTRSPLSQMSFVST